MPVKNRATSAVISPGLYKVESYVSEPIFLSNGEYFGSTSPQPKAAD